MLKLLLIFIVVPVAELFLLIELGRKIGLVWTLALIAVTGVTGAWLARRQGLSVLKRVRRELNEGKLPTSAAVDGLLILIAGAVLMTPGVLTDAFGFFCLTPAGRRLIRKAVTRWFREAVDNGRVHFSMNVHGTAHRNAAREMRDITPRSNDDRPAEDRHLE